MQADVIIIGTGQAGVPLATRLAQAGKRVLVAERGDARGHSVNLRCTPTKTMIASARAAHVARTCSRLGVHAGEVRVDLGAVVDRKDAIVRRWREGVEKRLAGAGERLTLLKGHARFVGEREIEVSGERHRAETVVINVGARPAVPPIPGLDSVPWLDNKRVMELRELPAHLLVLGGGYIGCEFGQMFRRFGSRLTIIQRTGQLLGREDPDVAEAVLGVMKEDGIEVLLNSEAVRVQQNGAKVNLNVRTNDGEQTLS